MNPKSFKRLLKAFAVATLGSTLLFGCASDEDSDQQSRLSISLTDAAGDFTNYTVDVSGLTLTRANGAVVNTLPNTTTLDFSQYIDVTEFLTTASVPVGHYTSAEITVDFRNAVLEVENEDGDSIPATAVDENGDPLEVVTLQTLINSDSGFNIRVGRPAHLTIDFDLEASNNVEIAPDGLSAEVTVNPVLIAETEIDTDDKERRLRGLLDSVDEAEGTFVVDIRPFRIRDRSFGDITVNTSNTTVFEIDGVSYGSADGLAALALKDPDTPIVTLGTLSIVNHNYTATEVFAGTSVPWADKDGLRGSILARDGETLTVIGATVELDDGRFSFNDTVEVLINADTKVTKQGSDEAVTIADLSVGQFIRVVGQMSDDDTMDATGTNDGIVRMRFSHLAGEVVSASPLAVELSHLNYRNPERYDFSGTGSDDTPATNADPENYEIDTGNLPLAGLEIGEPVRVKGHATPFGTAPEDFTAKTVIDQGGVKTNMFMGYGLTGSETAVEMLDESGLLLDLESTVGRHHLKQASVITDINDLDSVPLIVPAGERGLYALQRGRTLDIYTSWSGFSEALQGLLTGGAKVMFVISTGDYDAGALTLSSKRLVVRLTN